MYYIYIIISKNNKCIIILFILIINIKYIFIKQITIFNYMHLFIIFSAKYKMKVAILLCLIVLGLCSAEVLTPCEFSHTICNTILKGSVFDGCKRCECINGKLQNCGKENCHEFNGEKENLCNRLQQEALDGAVELFKVEE